MVTLGLLRELPVFHGAQLTFSNEESALFDRVERLSDSKSPYDAHTLYVADATEAPTPDELPPILLLANAPRGMEPPTSAAVALASGDFDLDAAIAAISRAVDEQREIAAARDRLGDALVAHQGLDQLVEVATEVLGNPMLVTDYTLRPLAQSTELGQGHGFWDAYSEHEITYENLHAGFENLADVLDSDEPILSEAEGDADGERIIKATIGPRSERMGFLLVFEHVHPFRPIDTELVKSITDLLYFQLREMRKTAGAHWASPETQALFRRVFEGQPVSGAMRKHLIAALGLPERPFYFAIVLGDGEKRVSDLPQDYLMRMFGAAFRSARCVASASHIVMVLSRKARKPFVDDKERERFELLLDDYGFSAGIGFPVHDLAELNRSYDQAVHALELGSRYSPGNIHRYADLMYLHVISEAAKHCRPIDMCDPRVIDVLVSDSRSGTELTNTLITYLRCDGETATAARELHIHRNTLYYRINKLEEDFDIHLKDIDDLPRLQLSANILIYATEGEGSVESVLQTLGIQPAHPEDDSASE